MFTMLRGMADVNPVPPPVSRTRRDRLRAQTRDEILAAGRTLVARGEEVSLRAVARTVGVTAPALYRYVDSHGDLLDLLGGALYDELIDELETARDAVDPADLPGRLIAVSHAFRRWALRNRHEYALLFANPLDTLNVEDPVAAPQDAAAGGSTAAGLTRFGTVFAELFVQMWQRGVIRLPDLDAVDPELLQMLERSAVEPMPLALHYLYVRQWSRLYGMVTLEAFGHLRWALADSRALFEAMIDDNAEEMGLGPQRREQRRAQRSNRRPNRREATASPSEPSTSR
jgi:AcrR family transcriptional regulator